MNFQYNLHKFCLTEVKSYYSQQEMKGHGKNTMLESVF